MNPRKKRNLLEEELMVHVTDRLGHDKRYAIDTRKIFNDLKWKSETHFLEGIEKTINWYLENDDWLKKITSGEYMEYYKKNYDWRNNLC